jgi:hypothetical protein
VWLEMTPVVGAQASRIRSTLHSSEPLCQSIAADVLDRDRCGVIAQIKSTAAARFANAPAVAQSRRRRYAAESPARKAKSHVTSRKVAVKSHGRGRRQKLPGQALNVLPVRTRKAAVADVG